MAKKYITWPVTSMDRESYCRRVSGFLGYSHLALGVCNIITVAVTAVIGENAGVPEGKELLETAYVQCIWVWLICIIGIIAHALSYRVNYPAEPPEPDHWLRFFKAYVFMMFIDAFLGAAAVFHAAEVLQGPARYGSSAATSAMVFGLFHISVQIGLCVRMAEILTLAKTGFIRVQSPTAVSSGIENQNLGTGSSHPPDSGMNMPNPSAPDYSHSAVRFNTSSGGINVTSTAFASGLGAKPYADDPPNYGDLFKS